MCVFISKIKLKWYKVFIIYHAYANWKYVMEELWIGVEQYELYFLPVFYARVVTSQICTLANIVLPPCFDYNNCSKIACLKFEGKKEEKKCNECCK